MTTSDYPVAMEDYPRLDALSYRLYADALCQEVAADRHTLLVEIAGHHL